MPIDRRSRTLCWVGFVLSSPAAPMNGTSVRWMKSAVLAPDVLPQLADRLEERQGLDVADGPADLDDDDVHAVGDGADAVLDLVGDVRDDLNRLAEIVAAPFASG